MNLAKPHSWPPFLLPPSLPLPSPSRRRPQPRPSRARRELRGEATQSASSPKGSRAHQAFVPAGVLGTAPLPPPANDVAMFTSPLPSPQPYFIRAMIPHPLLVLHSLPLCPGPYAPAVGSGGGGEAAYSALARALLLPQPLEQLRLATTYRTTARLLIPRAAVLVCPLEDLQVAAFSRTRARPRTPRAAVLAGPQ